LQKLERAGFTRSFVLVWFVTVGLKSVDEGFMHLVAMKISGNVFRLEETPWDYHNNLRPSASVVGGCTMCEVVLQVPDGVITKTPQPAHLHFSRLVQFEEPCTEIDLYDGPKLIMKFRPSSPTDIQIQTEK
jgi:hypothetical protein